MTWRRAGAAFIVLAMGLVALADPAVAVSGRHTAPRVRRIPHRVRTTAARPAPGGQSEGARTVGDTGGDANTVALTFDDGPDPRWTPQILDVLDAHHVHATFFVVGRAAAKYPDLVRSIAAHGDTVALHTWNHRRLTTTTAAGFASEVDPEIDLVSNLTGNRPVCLRPPYGAASAATVNLAAARNLRVVQWSVDPRDWTRPGADAIAARVSSHIGPNAIVLLHDGGGDRSQTVSALATILDRISQDGLPVATICAPTPPAG